MLSLTCGGEGDLVIVPLSGHTDSHLHLLQQGRMDIKHPAPHNTWVMDTVSVFVPWHQPVRGGGEEKPVANVKVMMTNILNIFTLCLTLIYDISLKVQKHFLFKRIKPKIRFESGHLRSCNWFCFIICYSLSHSRYFEENINLIKYSLYLSHWDDMILKCW